MRIKHWDSVFGLVKSIGTTGESRLSTDKRELELIEFPLSSIDIAPLHLWKEGIGEFLGPVALIGAGSVVIDHVGEIK